MGTQKALSPLSPRKTPRPTTVATPSRNTTNAQYDWLDCYTPTPQRPNVQELPQTYQFSEFILHRDQVLGEGAFAKVILATHRPTRQKAAVKVITKRAIPLDMREYVVKEPGVLAQLNHKNVVNLWLVHEDSEYIYMFLQYLPAGDLHTRLERDGIVEEDLARVWFKQIIAGLEYVHNSGFCHRDLKLENLLICGEGKKARLIMIDFGFASEMNPRDQLFYDFPGSVSYAAPELLQGIPYKGHSADVYSLGVILYTLTQGTYPHYSEDRAEMFRQITTCPATYDHDTSDALQELLTWMLMKKPENRPTLEQIKNHRFVTGNKQMLASPLKTTVSRLKQTARASLSPRSSRRRQSAY